MTEYICPVCHNLLCSGIDFSATFSRRLGRCSVCTVELMGTNNGLQFGWVMPFMEKIRLYWLHYNKLPKHIDRHEFFKEVCDFIAEYHPEILIAEALKPLTHFWRIK